MLTHSPAISLNPEPNPTPPLDIKRSRADGRTDWLKDQTLFIRHLPNKAAWQQLSWFRF